jgi:archaetidylinositol phosphate synthase
LLTRLRPLASRLMARAAGPLARLPADFYTVLGLAAVAPYLYACALGRPVLAAVLLLVSAALDALDGAVARLRREAGPRGAYLDSLLDRVADAAYAAGLLLLGFDTYLVYAYAVGSLLVSYARARYESLAGRSMEGLGLAERGDRVLLLALILLVAPASPSASEALLALAVLLVWLTFTQRLVAGYRSLPRRAA